MVGHLKFIASDSLVRFHQFKFIGIFLSVVVVASSLTFANIFKTHPKEFTLDDLSIPVFEEIINFVYNGKADINEENEKELLAAALKYDIKSLVQSINLQRNMKANPLVSKELETLKLNLDKAKYLFDKAIERNSIKNPFSQLPNRYY